MINFAYKRTDNFGQKVQTNNSYATSLNAAKLYALYTPRQCLSIVTRFSSIITFQSPSEEVFINKVNKGSP
jgi:hypothetical protein